MRDRAFAEIALGPNAEREIGGYEVGQGSFIASSNNQLSGKLGVLAHFLEKWHAEGERCLIFTQSVRMLDIIANWMVRAGYDHMKLDGRVSQKDRQKMVDDFNRSPRILAFLISTRVGGLGLNLTGASKVVIFDPMWNPSFDMQSQDRAYRLGQKKKVQVYRLLSKSSIEESIYKRQVYKQQEAHVAMHNTKERRLFTGTSKNKLEEHGELFGVENLFKHPREFTGIHDLLGDCEKMEKEFGDEADLGFEEVEYVAPERNEDDDGGPPRDDYGLSTVLNDIPEASREQKKKNRKGTRDQLTLGLDSQGSQGHSQGDVAAADAAHLRCLGVTSIHDNAKIRGESEVEKVISKRAERAAPAVEPVQMPSPPPRDADYATFGNAVPELPPKKRAGGARGASEVQVHAACECVAMAVLKSSLMINKEDSNTAVSNGKILPDGTVTELGLREAAELLASCTDVDMTAVLADDDVRAIAQQLYEAMPDDVKNFQPPTKKAKKISKEPIKSERTESHLLPGCSTDDDEDWH